mgnify:CR=1 FL=1
MADLGDPTDGYQSSAPDAVSAKSHDARETVADVLAEGLWVLLRQGAVGERVVTESSVTP